MFPFRCSVENGERSERSRNIRAALYQFATWPLLVGCVGSAPTAAHMYCRPVRSDGVAPDRTSRLFRAVKTQKEKSPQDSLGWLGGGGVEPPACEERGINPRRSADGLPPHMRSWRSALPFRCLVAGCGVEPPPWGLRPDAAGSRPYMPGGCAGRYSGIALFVDFDGFLLRFFAVLPVEFH